MEDKKTESMMESPRFNQSGNCKEHLRLEMDSLFQDEGFARVVIAVFVSRPNPTLEEVDDVKTTVSEAATSVVIRGYQGRGEVTRMEITADTQENVLEMRVKDTGVGIVDVKRAMEPMFTMDPEGECSGMGFSSMEAFMDQVDVQSEPGKRTPVLMEKSIDR